MGKEAGIGNVEGDEELENDELPPVQMDEFRMQVEKSGAKGADADSEGEAVVAVDVPVARSKTIELFIVFSPAPIGLGAGLVEDGSEIGAGGLGGPTLRPKVSPLAGLSTVERAVCERVRSLCQGLPFLAALWADVKSLGTSDSRARKRASLRPVPIKADWLIVMTRREALHVGWSTAAVVIPPVRVASLALALALLVNVPLVLVLLDLALAVLHLLLELVDAGLQLAHVRY